MATNAIHKASSIADQPKLKPENDPYFDCERDDDLEFFIDAILESNFGQIKKGDLINSVNELKAKQAKLQNAGSKDRRPDFQLNGLLLEKMKEYDALRDEHLMDFLSAKNRRKILIQTGLLTKDGFIVNNASAAFKKNRELQRKKHGTTNSKFDDERVKLDQLKHISPYYNKSWENKDKLYNRLYGKKKAVESVAKPVSVEQQKQQTIPLEQVDTNLPEAVQIQPEKMASQLEVERLQSLEAEVPAQSEPTPEPTPEPAPEPAPEPTPEPTPEHKDEDFGGFDDNVELTPDESQPIQES